MKLVLNYNIFICLIYITNITESDMGFWELFMILGNIGGPPHKYYINEFINNPYKLIFSFDYYERGINANNIFANYSDDQQKEIIDLLFKHRTIPIARRNYNT